MLSASVRGLLFANAQHWPVWLTRFRLIASLSFCHLPPLQGLLGSTLVDLSTELARRANFVPASLPRAGSSALSWRGWVWLRCSCGGGGAFGVRGFHPVTACPAPGGPPRYCTFFDGFVLVPPSPSPCLTRRPLALLVPLVTMSAGFGRSPREPLALLVLLVTMFAG